MLSLELELDEDSDVDDSLECDSIDGLSVEDAVAFLSSIDSEDENEDSEDDDDEEEFSFSPGATVDVAFGVTSCEWTKLLYQYRYMASHELQLTNNNPKHKETTHNLSIHLSR